MKCAAYECKSHENTLNDNGKPISFHRFPEDVGLKSIWVNNMGMKYWQPSQDSRLCSKHFTSDCYIKNSTTCLRKHGIPTIFKKYPDDVEQEEQEIKEEVDDFTVEEEEYVAAPPPTTVFTPDIVYLPHDTYADEHKKEIALLKVELNTTKRRLNKATEVAKRRLRKIRALQQQLRRRQKTRSNGNGSATILSVFKDYFVEFNPL